jgi:Ser/Thr protein kinase RdoA (MazF antagonist)
MTPSPGFSANQKADFLYMLTSLLGEYGFDEKKINVVPFGNGLINHTWKVEAGDKTFILQRINDVVFRNPQDITANIRLMADYLHEHHPEYLFVAPVRSANGDDMIFKESEGYFRLFPFVKNSHTIDVVATPDQAYEAAIQFGRFTRLLFGIAMEKFTITIPGFHDLGLRYRQFTAAFQNGNKDRISASKELTRAILSQTDIVSVYEKIKTDPDFTVRVTHHDTKISNVLFDDKGKGLCVIDLDTAMPGYFISDVGDMMRTYLSPASEDEKYFGKVEVREDFYQAIVRGYADAMKDELTETEKRYFLYAGKFMIYMQALRFLTDYLSDDIYYGEKYAGHNLVRAKNQLTLLSCLQEKEALLSGRIII